MQKSTEYRAGAGIFLLVIIVFLMAGGGIFIYNLLQTSSANDILEGKEIVNLLVVFEGQEKPLASYVIMYSPLSNKAAAVSVPGDTGLILVTADRMDRIDSVYSKGNIHAYKTEIERFLDIPLHYSIVFEREKLVRIVDLIDGVEIFIPQAMNIYGDELILFPYGNTLLDGDKGIQYIEFEITGEDRSEPLLRRERFFLGLFKRLAEKNYLFKNAAAAARFYPLLVTDMNDNVKKRLFAVLALVDFDRVSVQSVAGNYRVVSNTRMLFPHYEGSVFRDALRQVRRNLVRQGQDSQAERIFTVEVLNGTTTPGLAGRTADLIRGFRYDVVAAKNADRNDYEKTEIIDRTGLEEMVGEFADLIRCKNIRFEPRLVEDGGFVPLSAGNTEYGADFTLIIGRDFNGRIVTGN